MEQAFFIGKYGVGNGNFPPLTNSDEILTNLEMTSQRYMLPSPTYPYGPLYDIVNGHIQNEKTSEITSNEYRKWRCIESEEKLKRPKTEQHSTAPPSFNFNQLPELRSIEQVTANQQERHINQNSSTLTNFQLTPPQFPAPAKLSGKEKAYRKRHTLSEKTRLLRNLLPVERKMDIATTYEEAYKYIKYLKAQIAVLESMPVSSSLFASNFRSENPRFGELGKLNRQQLLEVLVNSPASQLTLYSNGYCVYSIEQLMLFKEIAEKSLFMISDH